MSSHRPARAAVLAVAAALAVITGLALSGCAAGQAVQNGPGSGDTNYVGGAVGVTDYRAGHRPTAPPVAGPALTGQRVSLSGYRGKVVVLNFWASWCGPCRSEAPVLAQLSRTYQGRGAQFIGVNIKDLGQANGAAYERSFGITYPSLYDPAGQVLLAFRDTVPPAAIPSTLVIDRTGHIAARIIGAVEYSSLNSLLGKLTAPAGSSPGVSSG
ncbi:MAG TPA: TlpA disulfide reductase family protein [Streptosporangiaceae bacterium]|nr:TlpA disulfide reductase family protein [Streptosporangiaceae bacterium]